MPAEAMERWKFDLDVCRADWQEVRVKLPSIPSREVSRLAMVTDWFLSSYWAEPTFHAGWTREQLFAIVYNPTILQIIGDEKGRVKNGLITSIGMGTLESILSIESEEAVVYEKENETPTFFSRKGNWLNAVLWWDEPMLVKREEPSE